MEESICRVTADIGSEVDDTIAKLPCALRFVKLP